MMVKLLNRIVKAIQDRNYEMSIHYWESVVSDPTRPKPSAIIASIGGNDPKVIEHYPDDPRGASCLLLGLNGQGVQIHSVIGYKRSPMKIITAYHPSNDIWINGKIRR